MARQSGFLSFSLYRSLRKPAWFALLVLCSIFCFGTRGRAASVSANTSTSSRAVASRFAIADFDGDSRPDLATVETGQIGASQARYWIGFRLSAGPHQLIGVTAPVGGLEISSRDVNGDNFLDLVVTTAWLKRPVAILVNDGHGNFTVADPAAFSPIIWSPEKTWTPPSFEPKDSAVAVLARASSDCVVNDRASEGSVAPQPLAIQTLCQRAFPLAVSVLGRAPPRFVNHV
jgi:hypothetical protein